LIQVEFPLVRDPKWCTECDPAFGIQKSGRIRNPEGFCVVSDLLQYVREVTFEEKMKLAEEAIKECLNVRTKLPFSNSLTVKYSTCLCFIIGECTLMRRLMKGQMKKNAFPLPIALV
jgi:hypothetical protein